MGEGDDPTYPSKGCYFRSRGLEEKKRIIQIGEILLARIDDEEWMQEEEFNEEVRPDR